MSRLQRFIEVDEINATIIDHQDPENTDDAVKIDNGNFHWGYKPEAKKEESKTDPKKDEKSKLDTKPSQVEQAEQEKLLEDNQT